MSYIPTNVSWWDDGPQDFQGFPVYDPTAAVDRPHQHVELAVICIADALAVITIIGRTYMRKKKLKTLRADDWWVIAAGLVLLCIWWPSQIAANIFGSGLHYKNITEANKKNFWIATWGFSGYYVVSSLIKVSICECHLALLPESYKKFRRFIKYLQVFILALGLFETILWNFDCQPFLSNFVWEIPGDTCLDLVVPRILWVVLSVIIDLIILYIPWRILKGTQLGGNEKRALMLVFTANLMGTIVCLINIYGIWYDQVDWYYDSVFTQTNLLMISNVEVLMYVLGASFPVLSPYLVARAKQADRGRFFFLSSLVPSFKKKFSSSSKSGFSTDKESMLEEGRFWEEIGLEPKNTPQVVASASDSVRKNRISL